MFAYIKEKPYLCNVEIKIITTLKPKSRKGTKIMKTTKNRSFVNRVFDAITAADANRINQGRIFRAYKRLKAMESTEYTEWDLRGLSNAEKEFMRENNMKSYYDCRDYSDKMHRYYIFINTDKATGKKHIYAYEKSQWLRLDGQDFGGYNWNYSYWLTIDTKRGMITKFNYEFRHSSMLSFFWPFG